MLYYGAVGVSARDLEMMRIIDELHLKYPFYGSRNIWDELRDRSYKVGGRVSTLMKRMGIEALYRKPRLSRPHPGYKIYPYLLRGLEIIRGNHVWAADINYLPMAKGFCYLVAIMDWDSRGRWMDNVFIERLWKSVKYEDVYLKAYGSIIEVRRGLRELQHQMSSSES